MTTDTVEDNSSKFCGVRLRKLCFYIGYLHLATTVFNVVAHLVTVGFVSDGFRCDFSIYTFNNIPWLFLEPILLFVNLGTHGFYSFPGIFRIEYIDVVYMDWPKCYVGMLHIYLKDLLNFAVNLLWLRIVISYIGALKKNNPDKMAIFIILSIVRVIMQITDFGYHPRLYDVFHPLVYCILKVVDIAVATIILVIIYKYFKELRAEKATQIGQNPPSYIDYGINVSLKALSALHEYLEKYKQKVEAVRSEEKTPLPDNIENPPENSV